MGLQTYKHESCDASSQLKWPLRFYIKGNQRMVIVLANGGLDSRIPLWKGTIWGYHDQITNQRAPNQQWTISWGNLYKNKHGLDIVTLSVVRRQCFGGFYRLFLKVFTRRRSRFVHPRFFGFGPRKKTGVHQRFLVASTALHETAGVTWQNY